ncbi:YcaO-like family protein [Streptomyces sp. NPDC102490]|uniref:YcaO-like family protein n=1 Tax=Streptomyces sp. NPDC102490 TaxID=3366183 RepID=UPI0037F36EF4
MPPIAQHELLTDAILDGTRKDDVPPERETPLGKALATVGDWLTAQRLTADIHKYGIDTAPTYEVRLTDADGALCSRSSGKGLGHRSLASALFESAEHYHLDWRRDHRADETQFLPAAAIAEQPTARPSALLRRLAGIAPKAPVLTRSYRPVSEALGLGAAGAGDNGASPPGAPAPHHHPVFLRDGGYRNWPHPEDSGAFAPLWHYTSSAGYAAGATLHEALLHAVNEAIERDAWSCLLASCYFRPPETGPALPVVDPAALPAELRELTAEVERACGGRLLIVSLTADTRVPAYLVCDATADEPVRLVGSGASPDPVYALHRALLEYLQVRTMYRHGPVDAARESEQIARALTRWPRHLAAARFDVRALPHRTVPFETADGLPATAAPEDLLRRLVRRLQAVGVEPHFRILTEPGAVTVVDVVVCGLEMLDKARAGYPVLPTGRLDARLRPQGSDPR